MTISKKDNHNIVNLLSKLDDDEIRKIYSIIME